MVTLGDTGPRRPGAGPRRPPCLADEAVSVVALVVVIAGMMVTLEEKLVGFPIAWSTTKGGRVLVLVASGTPALNKTGLVVPAVAVMRLLRMGAVMVSGAWLLNNEDRWLD